MLVEPEQATSLTTTTEFPLHSSDFVTLVCNSRRQHTTRKDFKVLELAEKYA